MPNHDYAGIMYFLGPIEPRAQFRIIGVFPKIRIMRDWLLPFALSCWMYSLECTETSESTMTAALSRLQRLSTRRRHQTSGHRFSHAAGRETMKLVHNPWLDHPQRWHHWHHRMQKLHLVVQKPTHGRPTPHRAPQAAPNDVQAAYSGQPAYSPDHASGRLQRRRHYTRARLGLSHTLLAIAL